MATHNDLEEIELEDQRPVAPTVSSEEDATSIKHLPKHDDSSSTANVHVDREDDQDEETCESKHPVKSSLFVTDNDERSRYDNPFRDWSQNEVEEVAQRIACEYGLESLKGLFIHAARALYDSDPAAIRNADYLTQEEKRSLLYEGKASFWDQPWPQQSTFLMLFIAAIVQGWNQTGTNGANLSWPPALISGGNSSNAISPNIQRCNIDPKDIWIFAAVNAAPYFAASVGCWLSDPLINELLFGRRGAIALSACLIFASAIGGAFTNNWIELFICRLLLGLGMGCKAAVVPVFAAEVAPAHLRGSLVMNWQVFDAVGIFLGFTANLVATTTATTAWRWQIASSAIPAFALLLAVLFVRWDSPRFLMKHEERFRAKYEKRKAALENTYQRLYDVAEQQHAHISPWDASNKGPSVLVYDSFRLLILSVKGFFRPNPAIHYRSAAYETLLLLRGQPILAAKELIYAHCQLLVETYSPKSDPGPNMNFSLRSRAGWIKRTQQLFTKPYIRREVYSSAVVMISQQLCGINVLIFYSSTLFCNAGSGQDNSSSVNPLLLSWGLGLTNVIFAIPAYWLIESRGRRWLLLKTIPFMAVAMAGAAGSFAIKNHTALKATSTVFTYLFTVFYSFGLGPVPFTLSAEMFPLEHRMVGMSLAVSLNFLAAGLLTFFVPIVRSPANLLGIFAALNVVALAFVWVFVREVAGADVGSMSAARTPESEAYRMTYLSLEELFYIFRLPTRMHVQYQWTVNPPYIWRLTRRLLRLKKVPAQKPLAFHAWGLQEMEKRASKGNEVAEVVEVRTEQVNGA